LSLLVASPPLLGGVGRPIGRLRGLGSNSCTGLPYALGTLSSTEGAGFGGSVGEANGFVGGISLFAKRLKDVLNDRP
jgi:hypothetical protein